jgi:hypothetical protein
MRKSKLSVWLICSSLLVACGATTPKTRIPDYAQAYEQAEREAAKTPLVLKPLEEREGLKCTDKPVAVSQKKISEAAVHWRLVSEQPYHVPQGRGD